MKRDIIFAGCLVLVACSHRPNHYDVKLQDGTPGYRLDCDQNEFSTQECVNEAARLCGGSAEVTGGSNNGSYTIVRCIK